MQFFRPIRPFKLLLLHRSAPPMETIPRPVTIFTSHRSVPCVTIFSFSLYSRRKQTFVLFFHSDISLLTHHRLMNHFVHAQSWLTDWLSTTMNILDCLFPILRLFFLAKAIFDVYRFCIYHARWILWYSHNIKAYRRSHKGLRGVRQWLPIMSGNLLN